MRMLGTMSTISSSAANSTSEGEKMERCGSDCPAMKGGAATVGGERNTEARRRRDPAAAAGVLVVVVAAWWAAGRNDLSWAGSPARGKKAHQQSVPAASFNLERRREGSSGRRRALKLLACSSPPVGRPGTATCFLGFDPIIQQKQQQQWTTGSRCWPPGAPLRASTRTTAFLRRHMTSRSASATCATFAGRRSPAASPASPTSTPTRPAPCASMSPRSLVRLGPNTWRTYPISSLVCCTF